MDRKHAHEEERDPEIGRDKPRAIPLAAEEDLPVCKEEDYDRPAAAENGTSVVD